MTAESLKHGLNNFFLIFNNILYVTNMLIRNYSILKLAGVEF